MRDASSTDGWPAYWHPSGHGMEGLWSKVTAADYGQNKRHVVACTRQKFNIVRPRMHSAVIFSVERSAGAAPTSGVGLPGPATDHRNNFSSWRYLNTWRGRCACLPTHRSIAVAPLRQTIHHDHYRDGKQRASRAWYTFVKGKSVIRILQWGVLNEINTRKDMLATWVGFMSQTSKSIVFYFLYVYIHPLMF